MNQCKLIILEETGLFGKCLKGKIQEKIDIKKECEFFNKEKGCMK